MKIELSKITVTFIGQIPKDVFTIMRNAQVAGIERFRNTDEEYNWFEGPFVTAYKTRDPNLPLNIGPWRTYTGCQLPDGDFYFIHPFASETAFPPVKKLVFKQSLSSAACCDELVRRDGSIRTVKLLPSATIYSDDNYRVIQVIDDKGNAERPSVSDGCSNPFRPDIGSPLDLNREFTEIRGSLGGTAQAILQRPPYFPVLQK